MPYPLPGDGVQEALDERRQPVYRPRGDSINITDPAAQAEPYR